MESAMKLTPTVLYAQNFAKNHPYAGLAIACLFSLAIFSPSAPKVVSPGGFCLVLGVLLFAITCLRRQLLQFLRDFPAIFFAILFVAFLASYGFFASQAPLTYLFFLCAVFAAICLIYLTDKKKLETWHIAFLIGFLSFILHLIFILYTPFDVLQHDLGDPGTTYGHISYIEFFINNNFALPQFDLRQMYGYQNPPLHHLVAALWLKIAGKLTTDYYAAIESLQMLTLFYSGWVTITCYKFFKELGLTKAALLVPFAIVCAHPSLVLFAGLLNNDVLCLALMMQAALFALRWYKNPSVANILAIAVCIGLSMFTKSTGAMLAPAVAFLFLVRLLQSKGQWRRLFIQFAVFGLVCIPLGLWWNIYYLLKFNVPLFYVPNQGVDSFQYIGHYPAWQRLFDFNPMQFKMLYHDWGNVYYEYNIPVAIFKTSVFGEFNYAYNPYLKFPSVVLFYSNIALIAASLLAMLHGFFAGKNFSIKAFLLIFYFCVMASYVNFCFAFPHSCTMNYRYILPSFIIGCCFLGFSIKQLHKAAKPFAIVCRTLIFAISGIFCFSSFLFYALFTAGGPINVNML